MGDTARNRVIHAVMSSTKHRSPLIPEDSPYLKPLIFPNHERKFRLATLAVTGVISVYMVFLADWGDREHCFSPIRRFALGQLQSFLTIRPEDEDQVRQRVERMRSSINDVKGAIGKTS